MTNSTVWRAVSIGLGIACAGLSAYGAFELAKKLEGGSVSYLVIAAPVIVAAAALIPPIAEACWRSGARVKFLLWWLVLIPAAATAFYAAAERVHLAKAGAQAERAAYRSAAARAKEELEELKPKAGEAKAKADETKGWRVCGPKCEGIRAKAERLKAEVEEAEAKLLKAEAAAVEESPLKAPVWLLPLALDLIAFMAIWSGLTGPRPSKAPEPVKAPAKRAKTAQRRRRKAVAKAKTPSKPRLVYANDNVWTPPAA